MLVDQENCRPVGEPRRLDVARQVQLECCRLSGTWPPDERPLHILPFVKNEQPVVARDGRKAG
jgi:hypothetical protein